MGKGSGRRPQQVTKDQFNSNWDNIFNKTQSTPTGTKDLKCQEKSQKKIKR